MGRGALRRGRIFSTFSSTMKAGELLLHESGSIYVGTHYSFVALL